MYNTRQFGTINYLSPVSLNKPWEMQINSGQFKGQKLDPAIFYQNKAGKYVLLEQAKLGIKENTFEFAPLKKLDFLEDALVDTSNPRINTYKLFIGYILKENNKESVYIQSSMQIGQYKLAPSEPTFDSQNNLIGKAFQKGDKITIKVGDKEVSSTDSAKEDGSWRIDNLRVNSPYTITESNEWGDVPMSRSKNTNNQNQAQQNQAFRITKIDPIDFREVELTSYPTIAKEIHEWSVTIENSEGNSWSISAQVGEHSQGMDMFYIDHQYKWQCLNTSQKIFSANDVNQGTTNVDGPVDGKYKISIAKPNPQKGNQTPGFGVHIDTGTIGLGPKQATINLTLARTP